MPKQSVNPTKCKYCGGPTFIKDTKLSGSAIRRHRECKLCSLNSTTYEISDLEMQKYAVQQKSINIIANQIAAIKES